MKKIAIVLVLLAAAGFAVWWRLNHVVAQPGWIAASARDRYFYGSIGAGETAGIPYWTWLVLPRMFPEYLPGPGGYASLGLSWEEGKEMPVGFAKQRVGYVRVTGNCALCHALSRPTPGSEVPTIVPVATGETTRYEPLFEFYRRSAADPRFTADDILGQVDQFTRLSVADRLLYRYVLIPRARTMLADPARTLFDRDIRQHILDPKRHRPSVPLPNLEKTP